ncbi:MAG: tRNA adenosine(34) deaminase TadA [Coriobacteriia bacterium]|nr:tRNA adenosine(34) deaminase TadA [Coriobacteriia bacterium]
MTDTDYMKIALDLARQAADAGEVPVGALVVKDSKIISQAFNMREAKTSPSAHAEFLAIEQAASVLKTWRLEGCSVYVTLEPCVMCAGLMHQARIERCVFGAFDKKAGALGTLYEIHKDERLNHNFEVCGGVMKEECAKILSDFFRARR